MKLIRDYMKINVISFDSDTSVFDAAKVFSENNISGAPVVENEKVVGVISVTDIIKFMKTKLPKTEIYVSENQSLYLFVANLLKEQIGFRTELRRISKTRIKDLMSTDIIHIHPDNNILEAATMMEKYDVDRLPVIDQGKLIGIISRVDLVRALIE
jgi:CBS domain-containing protein